MKKIIARIIAAPFLLVHYTMLLLGIGFLLLIDNVVRWVTKHGEFNR